MQKNTTILGLLLIILGLISYFGSGQSSVTALIPAFFGIVFTILAMVSLAEKIKKHTMHAAVAFAMLGVIGAARGVPGFIDIVTGVGAERPLAIYAQMTMLILCLGYIFLSFRSFREARKNQNN